MASSEGTKYPPSEFSQKYSKVLAPDGKLVSPEDVFGEGKMFDKDVEEKTRLAWRGVGVGEDSPAKRDAVRFKYDFNSIPMRFQCGFAISVRCRCDFSLISVPFLSCAARSRRCRRALPNPERAEQRIRHGE